MINKNNKDVIKIFLIFGSIFKHLFISKIQTNQLQEGKVLNNGFNPKSSHNILKNPIFTLIHEARSFLTI